VPTPASVTLGHWDLDVARVTRLKLPLVVKPARQGSSVGVRIVQLHAELQQACLEAWHHDRDLVVEEFVKGRELTVGVLGQDVLPVIEVRPKHEFFTFDAKYNDGQTEYDVPANLTPLETAQAQALARRAHECLGCRDMSRVDIILGEDGHMVVLEVNTIPGFTKTSLLPKAASKAGLDFPRLCLRLAEMALERRADKQRASGRERELAACAT
jgi:D-alanine-D-alanine ligase